MDTFLKYVTSLIIKKSYIIQGQATIRYIYQTTSQNK